MLGGVSIPVNVLDFNQSYDSIINFSIVPKEVLNEWSTEFKAWLKGGKVEPKTEKERRVLEDVETDTETSEAGQNALINSLIFFSSIALVGALILVLICMRKSIMNKLPNVIKNLFNKIMDMLMYNSVLRFVIQTYQIRFYGAVLALKASTEETSTVSTVTQYSIIVILVLFAIFQGIFLVRNREELHKAKFKSRFDSLYKDVNTLKPGNWQLLFTTLHCIRRSASVLIILLFVDNFYLKLLLLVALTQI